MTTFEEQHEHNLHLLRLARDDQGWTLSRLLLAEQLEAEVRYLREGLELIARGAHTNPPEAISALAYARLGR